ncbi:MAG: DUF2723 domain-containing protein [Candidatus Eisenbacteria bacterium]|uniref:DUF2723 domain-containing protein n=1 Tax=Eiseniibacteriota bacterium TaxID=2212470 RepID=A0A933SDK4_UNCEI|nr:DUF2723 domain-containing protein [Candidatus Eisenbacteria bacterium]
MALAPRCLGEGDSAEFTLALALTGAAHPPGYPLYTLAGSVFVHALRGAGLGWAHAANLWSACGAAAAIFALVTLADRLLPPTGRLRGGARACVIALALLPLAAHPTFLRAATQAEVYSWEVAWTAALAVTALGFLRHLDADAPPLETRSLLRAALAWGALAGVALAHRPTMLAFAGSFTVTLASSAARRGVLRPALLAAAFGAALLPASANLWFAYRALHPAAFQWPLLEPGVNGLLQHTAGAIYRSYLGARVGGGSGLALVGTLLPLFALGAAALAWMIPSIARRGDRPALACLLALAGAAVAQGAFVAVYAVSDFDFFLLPALVPVTMAFALALARMLERSEAPLTPAALALTTSLCVAAVPVVQESARLAQVAAADASVREAFDALPFERGVVVWNSDSHTRLVALQLLEGRKRGVVVLNGGVLTWPAARRDAAKRLGFDPLEGLELRTDEDLARIAPHLAERPGLAVADFGLWWSARAAGN